MSGEENTPSSKPAVPQCQFFVQRKKRLCRMTVKPGRQYCGEHEPQPKTEAGQTDKRIPCPNDPKHTCYASKLLKHLAICNARRTEQPPYIVENVNAPEAADSCPRLPLGTYPKDVLANVIDKVNHLYAKHVEGHITAEPPSAIHRAVLPEFSEQERSESSRRHLRQVSALLWGAERARVCAERACYVEPGAGKGQLSYYAAHAWCAGTGSRVLAVDRAPLRHKRDNKLRSAPPTNPGNTQSSQQDENIADITVKNDQSLSSKNNTDEQTYSDSNGHVIAIDTNNARTLIHSRISNKPESDIKAIHLEKHTTKGEIDSPNSSIENSNVPDEVMVDVHEKSNRDSKPSQKGENRIDTEGSLSDRRSNRQSVKGESGENDTEQSDEVAVRLRADLAHLALEAVPVVAEADAVVGLAKHLCGVATDYALRCLAAPRVVGKTRGVVLATCCHHRVERAPYVANRQLQELGINAEEFNIMLGIVSWATCGDGRSRERRLAKEEEALREDRRSGEEASGARRRQAEREETGRRAKALLDWGRVLWLRERGFDARLCYYVPREVSLENVAIIASKLT